MSYNNFTPMFFVNGLEEAKAYQVLPNQTTFLMDNNSPTFYMKSSNQIGQVTLKAYEFKEVCIPDSTTELSEIKRQLSELTKLVKGDNVNESNNQ